MNTGEQSGQAHIDSPLTHGGVHTLAPPRCRFAAIYLIAACAFPGGFYDIGNSKGISYINK